MSFDIEAPGNGSEADTGPSGSYRERRALGKFLDNFKHKEKHVVAICGIRCWREIQIWYATDGAFHGYPLNYETIISEEALRVMLRDRPGSLGTNPKRHFSDTSSIPADLTGDVCIRGKWYHES